jgi:hypothetical protein
VVDVPLDILAVVQDASPAPIIAAGTLDLDYLRTHIRQDGGAVGTGDVAGEIDDANTF